VRRWSDASGGHRLHRAVRPANSHACSPPARLKLRLSTRFRSAGDSGRPSRSRSAGLPASSSALSPSTPPRPRRAWQGSADSGSASRREMRRRRTQAAASGPATPELSAAPDIGPRSEATSKRDSLPGGRLKNLIWRDVCRCLRRERSHRCDGERELAGRSVMQQFSWIGRCQTNEGSALRS
jgi:hypothetical protein